MIPRKFARLRRLSLIRAAVRFVVLMLACAVCWGITVYVCATTSGLLVMSERDVMRMLLPNVP